MLNVWRSLKECPHPSKKCLPSPSTLASLIHHDSSSQVEAYWHRYLPPTCFFFFCSWSALHVLTDVSCHRLWWGPDPNRSEWQGEVFLSRLRDKLHSSSCNVTEPEILCPQDRRGRVPVCPSQFVVVRWPAVGSDEVLSAVSVHQHRSESLRRAWNWPAASGTYPYS